MSNPSAYPSFWTSPRGPRPNNSNSACYTPHVPDYDAVTLTNTFEDGGHSFGVVNTVAPTGWTIIYAILSPAEAKILDDHYASAQGQAYSFSFTDREGLTHTGVRYSKGGYKRSHTKQHLQRREVTLTKDPA